LNSGGRPTIAPTIAPANQPAPAASSAPAAFLGVGAIIFLIAGMAFCLVASGAAYFLFRGSGPRELCPVTGKVTFNDGGPLTAGEVTFFEVPTEAGAGNQGMICKGAVRADGSYTMTNNKQEDGVPEGKYKVVVTPARPPDPANPPPNWPPFQSRFSRLNETPLEFTVTRGVNEYPITVER